MWKTSLLISRTKMVEILWFCGVITEQSPILWLGFLCYILLCLTF